MSRRLLLCTDLDRTLLPNGEAAESPGARPRWRRLVDRDEVVLVYVTGRDRDRVREALETWMLPPPAFVIADVGASMYRVDASSPRVDASSPPSHDKSWTRVKAWDEVIGPDWRSNTREDLADALSDLPALTLQDPSRQRQYKLSYHVALAQQHAPIDAAIAERLDVLGVRANLVWSVDVAEQIGLLDVLPASANKLHAVTFVRETLGIPVEDTLFAGDSGNDLAALTSIIPAVVVANAEPEVTAEAMRLSEEAGTRSAIYAARGPWRGLDGSYAAGILEGVAHYHPDRVARWIGDENTGSDAGAVIFGEVLFDCFEDGTRVLGGAPFNVAWHLAAFGATPLFVSRVGDDAPGSEVDDAMRAWGMRRHGLQHDEEHATGEVLVRLKGGEPAYEIRAGRAWDHIAAPKLEALAPRLLYHGTLALRSAPSQRALQVLRDRCSGPIFVDVNLRAPWWDRELVLDCVTKADIVKLSEDELAAIDGIDGLDGLDGIDGIDAAAAPLAKRALELHRRLGARWLVVTRGAAGALGVGERGTLVEVTPASPVPAGAVGARGRAVVDTVGAGDAFASVLILGALHGWSLHTAMDRAQMFASRIVTQRGATSADRSLYDDLSGAWLADSLTSVNRPGHPGERDT